MKLRWIIPLAVLLPLRLNASEPVVRPRVATVIINPAEVTPLHLRMGFVSTIRMPEEVSSVALGNRTAFAADHSEGEPLYVYVRPITSEPAESNLVIATKSGAHVTLELISGGDDDSVQPVDFLIEYRVSRGFLVLPDGGHIANQRPSDSKGPLPSELNRLPAAQPVLGELGSPSFSAALDAEYELQAKINAPSWTKWKGMQIETSIGDIRQWNNQTVVSYSIFNSSDKPVEIVPPQIQMTGRKLKKKKKKAKGIISDQLEIREYRLSASRIEAGGRVDGTVVFDRPNFKQSTEKLFLQIAQSDQVDHPILIPLPFTPPIAGRKER